MLMIMPVPPTLGGILLQLPTTSIPRSGYWGWCCRRGDGQGHFVLVDVHNGGNSLPLASVWPLRSGNAWGCYRCGRLS